MIHYAIRQPEGDMTKAEGLAKSLSIQKIAAELLCMRGCDGEERARRFLNPAKEDMHDPFLFEQMGDAVDCILAAVDMGEKICVYGDYDVDGIMAVTLLSRYLASIGADVMRYIPERRGEGYGLNREAVDKVVLGGAALMITVDCGITAIAEIAYAQTLGLEVIVTDHHQCLETLPDCIAVINPQCSDAYPFKGLCGAGVALKLVQALAGGGVESVEPYLQYAAMATIADIVSLTDENRVIASAGLELINGDERALGIKALAEAAGYANRLLDEWSIGFTLAPRINAAGRTGSPARALELFMTDEPAEAKKLAAELDEENKRRQEIEGRIMAGALEQIDKEIDVVECGALVLQGDDWNPGVIGIVASRLVERFCKPAILLAKDGDDYIGSGRSIKGVHLFNALTEMSGLFTRFGGHEMAAGLTIKAENIPKFKEGLEKYLKKNVEQSAYVPTVYYDIELKPSDITLELVKGLSRLAPFGIGNPSPVFRINGRIANARTRGSDSAHLSFLLDGSVDCIAFSQGSRLAELSGETADMLCTLKLNTYKDERVQCDVKKIRPSAEAADSFLKLNEWKFYDAFFRTPEETGEKGGEVKLFGFDEVAEALEKRPQGSVIICFTPGGAKRFLEFAAAAGLHGRFDITGGRLTDCRAYNTLLLAPELTDTGKLSKYKKAFICDDFPSAAARDAVQAAVPEVFTMGHIGKEYFESVFVPRERLIPVYKAMLALCVRESSFDSLEGYVAALNKYIKADIYTAAFALRVFCELGFFKTGGRGAFKLSAVKDVKKRELTESASYMRAKNAAAEYDKLRSHTGAE